MFLFETFGGKNKELDYYKLNLIGAERDCQIASYSVIFLAWVICLITSALYFAHVDTAKTAGDPTKTAEVERNQQPSRAKL